MLKRKLDSLLWEQIPTEEYLSINCRNVEQEYLDEIPFEDIYELRISRDDNYNIKVFCARDVLPYSKENDKKKKTIKLNTDNELTSIPKGKLCIKDDCYETTLMHCYINEIGGNLFKTEYKLSCDKVVCINKQHAPFALREWVLNGSQEGLRFYVNNDISYKIEGATYGLYGDFDFPHKSVSPEAEYQGGFTHIRYKDTAFDIHFMNSSYGPKWSVNFSISYFEKYGRIPDPEEREIIRDYLGFFMGKRLICLGNSIYDASGNVIGFEIDNSHIAGFNIQDICKKVSMPPIDDSSDALDDYVNELQNHIDEFSDLYKKLDFDFLFRSYWYAKEVVVPLDIPILASALEHLVVIWYKEAEDNPETTLVGKKEFSRRIKPVKDVVKKCFDDTEYKDRMIRSIESMNRMSVSERFEHFFNIIGLEIGEMEKKALSARNFPAHGNYHNNFDEYHKMSQIYRSLINRVVLKLLNYEGANGDLLRPLLRS